MSSRASSTDAKSTKPIPRAMGLVRSRTTRKLVMFGKPAAHSQAVLTNHQSVAAGRGHLFCKDTSFLCQLVETTAGSSLSCTRQPRVLGQLPATHLPRGPTHSLRDGRGSSDESGCRGVGGVQHLAGPSSSELPQHLFTVWYERPVVGAALRHQHQTETRGSQTTELTLPSKTLLSTVAA